MYAKTRPNIALIMLASAAGMAILSGHAYAQTAPAAAAQPTTQADQGGAKVEEIVVTAQRRSENLQSVPIAISAVTGADLASHGVNNTQDLTNTVPGLNISTNVGNTLVFIRGVGTTALSVENDVGVYVDGVYISSQTASLLNLTNIDHIEVLKGPQGTLFGRNAIGGAIQIVTKDPSPTPQADISVGYANYNTPSINVYASTRVTDNLATDIALFTSKQWDGWGKDLTTGKDIFTGETVELRNKWVYTPTDRTKVTLSLDYSYDKNQLGANWHFLPGALGVDGVSTYPGFYNSLADGKSQNQSQQYGGMLRIDQDFGWARGVSITAYRDSRNHNFVDQDATPIPVVEGGPTPQDDKAFSQELQLLSPADSKVNWIVGAYYLHDDYYTPGFNIQVGTALHETLVVDEPTDSFAGFGQAAVEILPGTHVTGGLRYTYDEKSVDGQTFVNGAHIPPLDGSQSANFKKLTYRIVLDHQFTPDILGYVSYDTGFKSGQFNLISYNAAPVQPEELKAWQGGFKTELFDHRLRLNLAGFHYDYSNIQITQVITGGTTLLNAASAEIYGADLDMAARISQEFSLQGALSLLHGRYTNFPNAPSYVPTGFGGNMLTTIPNAAGNTTVKSPDVTAYVAADWVHELAQGQVELNGNVSYNSGYFWNVDNRLKQPAYALVGAFVKWTPPGGRWDLRLWANNLTDKRYYAYEDAFSLGDIGSPAAPRTYGVTVHVHLD